MSSISKKILVIEDDPYIRDAVSEILQLEGYSVLSAENGEAGLEQLRKDRATDLILLDLMMPIKDGFQFRREQEEDPRIAEIPVVLMSADESIVEKKIRIGAKSYVKKPIDMDKLLNTVRQYCAP